VEGAAPVHSRAVHVGSQWEAANVLRSIEKKAIREAEAASAKQEKTDAREEKAKAHAAAAEAAPEVV
jgi:hypothetical protein